MVPPGYGAIRCHLVTSVHWRCILKSEFAIFLSLYILPFPCAGHLTSMSGLSSPIPFISISPPPEDDPIEEPFSPFSALPVPPIDQNAFRPSHLTPPTTITSFKRPLSPLHPIPAVGQGLESQRFQILLAASKHRKVSAGSDQSANFRKEIAMRAHKNGHGMSLHHFQLIVLISSFSRSSCSLPV